MRRPERQRLGFVLTILGYLFVFGQSFAHGYAHLELAHHETEHHADAAPGHDEVPDHHEVSAISDAEEPAGHYHAVIDDSVATRTLFTFLAVIRPVLADELEPSARRTLPPERNDLVPRHSLHSTAPPNLRAPPVG